MIEKRLLTTADIERTTEIMAQAFCDDPAWSYVVPQAGQRQAILARLFRRFAALYIRNQQVYGVGDPLQGIAIWSVPNQRPMSPLGFLSLDLFKLLFTPGLLAVSKRSLQIGRAAEVLKKQYVHPPCYYLEALAVAPEAQGQGLASKLVRPFLAQADAQALSVYLDTFNAANVPIYEHYGFVCREQREVPELGLRLWLFQRPAQ